MATMSPHDFAAIGQAVPLVLAASSLHQSGVVEMSIRKQGTCVRRAVVAVLALAVLFIGSTTASAQFANKKTTVTFNEPVEIPGVNAQVLPAGVYVFRLLDSLSDRHIVQVFNK